MNSHSNTLPQLVWRVFVGAYYRVKIIALRQKYTTHAYPKTFDWQWRETNYNRIAAVNLVVSQFQDCQYLEIGCANNSLFDSVPVRDKFGVDPARGGTHRMTSDAFFEQNTQKFDVIFIDGLHTYEQVRKDVVNSISALNPNGWVLMHDMLPRNWTEHHVPNLSASAWTGDVWKVAFELAKTDGIELRLLKIDQGVAAFKLTKSNPQLVDMQAELIPTQFAYFYENISQLPLASWEDSFSWLSGKA